MRSLLLSTILVCVSYCVQAQYSKLKAVAVQATKEMWVSDGEIKTNNIDQCYTFSFKDKLLCHIIYEDGSISDAQFYTLSTAIVSENGGETVYKVKATSGVSGNTYSYELKIDDSGRLLSLVRTQPGGSSKATFTGLIIDAKSILQ